MKGSVMFYKLQIKCVRRNLPQIRLHFACKGVKFAEASRGGGFRADAETGAVNPPR